MKQVKLGDFLFWKNQPGKVIGETDQRQVIIEILENKKCPHCNGDLGKKQIHVIPTSPLFQENAKSIPTITD